jgi:uncharacterized protein
MIDYNRIRSFLCKGHFDITGIHGVTHWDRVRDIGLFLSEETGADETVIKLFALFHDSMRVSNREDDGHGYRAYLLLSQCRGILFDLDDVRFNQLRHACMLHTNEIHNSDVTIATCYDADRLDLVRLNREINPLLLNTDYAIRFINKRR